MYIVRVTDWWLVTGFRGASAEERKRDGENFCKSVGGGDFSGKNRADVRRGVWSLLEGV